MRRRQSGTLCAGWSQSSSQAPWRLLWWMATAQTGACKYQYAWRRTDMYPHADVLSIFFNFQRDVVDSNSTDRYPRTDILSKLGFFLDFQRPSPLWHTSSQDCRGSKEGGRDARHCGARRQEGARGPDERGGAGRPWRPPPLPARGHTASCQRGG